MRSLAPCRSSCLALLRAISAVAVGPGLGHDFRMTRPWIRPLGAVWALLAVVGAVSAQQFDDAYQQAQTKAASWRGLVRTFPRAVRWLDGGAAVGWVQTEGGVRAYVRVDCATGERRSATDAAALGMAPADGRLVPQPGSVRSKNGGEPVDIEFHNGADQEVRLFWVDADGVRHDYGLLAPGADRRQHSYVGHAFVLVGSDGATLGAFVAAEHGGRAEIGERSRQLAAERRPRRERPRARVFVRDDNLFVRGDGDGARALTQDGSRDDAYRGEVHVSPDGRKALAFQVVPEQEHTLTLVESAPKDQLQPKVHTQQYLKPGDRIARPRPRLFDLETGRRIEVDEAPFADAWSLGRVQWTDDSAEVRLLYNRRGHQQLCVRAIDAQSGAVRTIVDERSETFVDYSQKTCLRWLDGGRELLWASERSGHNHLYRIDAATGGARALTQGAFNVRSVEHVDEERGEVWIAALGFAAGQDPYHRHLLRVPLDGGPPVPVTAADGDHEWDFAPDREHVVVRWSRVDCPTVTELRRCRDGALMAELGRDDWAPLLGAGFRPARRFVAKGRDGQTDIHGLAILPSSSPAGAKLPVLEAIYAGPHDFHVPKRFDLQLRLRALAELGFCVVQIDGMGTNWRSKAFHDVCWQNLKDAGFPDRIAWIRALAAELPELDAARVGIFGGSAGGQNALAALLWHGDFYQAAAADCGCHDNRMDKIWWNEAWMGWPIGDHYAASSNVVHAARLQGKLLLTVGELDRNVDPASTLQVVDALLEAGKDFEFVLVPGGGHGCGEAPKLAKKRAAFFWDALRPQQD